MQLVGAVRQRAADYVVPEPEWWVDTVRAVVGTTTSEGCVANLACGGKGGNVLGRTEGYESGCHTGDGSMVNPRAALWQAVGGDCAGHNLGPGQCGARGCCPEEQRPRCRSDGLSPRRWLRSALRRQRADRTWGRGALHVEVPRRRGRVRGGLESLLRYLHKENRM